MRIVGTCSTPQSMPSRKLNTMLSYAFRAAVGVHFACLYVLIFVLRKTLAGAQHYAVAVALTLLMAAVVALFVADMATRTDEERQNSKFIDGVIGLIWFATVAFLSMNSLRAGDWCKIPITLTDSRQNR